MQKPKTEATESLATIAGACSLKKINYPGFGNDTQLFYDSIGRNIKVIETTASTVTDTTQYVWDEGNRSETRDVSGGLVASYFDFGEVRNGNSRFYSRDHLGNVRELSDSSAITGQFSYDPWGDRTRLSGTESTNNQFAELYEHPRSDLKQARFRDYKSSLAKWLSRDPIAEQLEEQEINLYSYVNNDPISFTDEPGLMRIRGRGGSNSRRGGGQGRSNGQKPRKPFEPPLGWCLSPSCCWEQSRRCRYTCIILWFALSKDASALNHCIGCCHEKYGECLSTVAGRKRYPKPGFDCPLKCLAYD